jgi:glycosyltransferase involved in cell wall biosynthesis
VEDLIYTLEGHRQSGNKLNWLKYVSDEQLEECYSRAECLILASEGEGFGLPIIEAARRGVPLLLRDIPIFREVGKDGASFFSSTQPEQVAVEIENWIRDYEIGRIPRSKNIPSTTWSTSAEAFMMEIRNRLF